jgi:hypothetical protein
MGERRLDFMRPADFEAAYGPPPPSLPCLAALHFVSSDLDRSRDALAAGGVDYRETGGALQATAEGVVFRFENA